MKNHSWVKLYRKIIESKIWETKPSSWIICWLYILLKVSFENNSSYKKGQAHFRSVDKELLPFDITNDIWYRCINWLEQEGMIKRQKVWRGEIITVVNYEKYQSYPNHTQIIKQHIKPNANDENLEEKNAIPKSYPNHTQIIPPINIDKTQVEDPPKNIRNKEIRNKDLNNIYGAKIIFNNQTFKFENISEEKINKWKEAFPNCNVDLELKKMEAWLVANPKKRYKNYEKFIVNWLSRAKGGKDSKYISVNSIERKGGEANAGEW
jgi:hypothetical protein